MATSSKTASSEKPVWFITGCSTGFGRELAKHVLECGYRAVVTARNLDDIADLAAKGEALVLKLDVTDQRQIDAAIKAAEEKFGCIDVLVNNAGIGYFAAVEESEEDQVRRMFEINLFGLGRMIRAALPGMRSRRRGFIINFSSIGGLRSFPSLGYYNATKFAVEDLSEALWQEVEPLGIKVMLVEPSGFRTDWAGRSADENKQQIDDYAATAGAWRSQIRAISGKQPGDPLRAAQAIVKAAESPNPPHHLLLATMLTKPRWQNSKTCAKSFLRGKLFPAELISPNKGTHVLYPYAVNCTPQRDGTLWHMKTKAVIRTNQREMHRSGRAGWLRAAVLGSDDAIVSTASLMIGVAASSASKGAVLVAGVAGLVAGSMSMAVGEYVSVSSQRDAEQADIKLEKQELTGQPEAELHELAMIYVKRGLDKELAIKVAEQLSTRDRLGAHMLDELRIDQASLARPMQAAWISAASFASFAVVPITALLVAPVALRIPAIAALSLVSLAALGAFGGHLGGAPLGRASLRVTLGGALAMAVTAVIGKILGVSGG